MLRTQADVERLIQRLLRDSGEDPADVIEVRPFDAGWGDALFYGITRREGRGANIY